MTPTRALLWTVAALGSLLFVAVAATRAFVRGARRAQKSFAESVVAEHPDPLPSVARSAAVVALREAIERAGFRFVGASHNATRASEGGANLTMVFLSDDGATRVSIASMKEAYALTRAVPWLVALVPWRQVVEVQTVYGNGDRLIVLTRAAQPGALWPPEFKMCWVGAMVGAASVEKALAMHRAARTKRRDHPAVVFRDLREILEDGQRVRARLARFGEALLARKVDEIQEAFGSVRVDDRPEE